MIRRAEERDINRLMEIYNEAVLHTTATFDTEVKDYADRLEWFQAHQDPHIIMVSETDGQVSGYASLSRYRERKAFDTTVEISVYVDPAYQRQHIGSSLVESVLAYARECSEIHTVISLITGENQASIQLHEAYGFQYCGQIRHAGTKFGKTLDLNIYEIIKES